MNPVAVAASDSDVGNAVYAPTSRRNGLSGILAANARLSPERPAFADQPGRYDWSRRREHAWTYASADAAASRLAGFFRTLGLPAGSLVGVSLPSGSEVGVLLAALDRADLVACLLPLGWSREQAAVQVERLGIACVVTQSIVGPLRPAETWREIAAGYYGLRFLTAFGPEVPDGVIDLDRVIEQGDLPGAPLADDRDAGFVSFEDEGGGARPVFRTWRSALAAARVFLAAARYAPEDRIVTLLAQDDFRALTTGLVASLAVGASLEVHGLFSGGALLRSLRREGAIRLVTPGWMEADLARLDLSAGARGVVLVHQTPVRFKAQAPLTHGVVDALAFGERALLAQPRNSRGRFALALEAPAGSPGLDSEPPLDVRRDTEGRIAFRGIAAEAAPLDGPDPTGGEQLWRDSGYVAEVFAGIVIGVTRADD